MSEEIVHRLFRIGILLKGIDGCLELVGGALLLAIPRSALDKLVRFLTQHELSEDPRDILANLIVHAAQHLSAGTKRFAAIYLLFHGAVKIFLVVSLWRDRLWAYPAAMFFLVAFLAYQIYRLAIGFSVGLAALTVFDVVIVILVRQEYRHARARSSP